MALPVRKGYKGAPAKAVLTNSPTNSDTSFVVDTVVGWATTFPFYCVVEPGSSREEKVKVTAISGTTLTVVRAQDDTSAQGHNAGASIYPVFTADEADEANEIASVMTTKGDLIATNGTAINRLGVGTNTHVLQADSTATNGVKWGQIVEAGIADSAVTSAKIAAGTIVNDDINGSAAISLSKLATGALPVAITVASANIVDNTIVFDDLATALQNLLVPTGSISAYAGSSAPTGWLMCDGQSTTGYTALAAVVGSTVPDLRGRVIAGVDNMGGTAAGRLTSTTLTASNTLRATGGTQTHVLTLAEIPSHNHEQILGGNLSTVASSAGSNVVSDANSSVVSSSGGGGAHLNVQPTMVLNYIIKT